LLVSEKEVINDADTRIKTDEEYADYTITL
jgi:outer membrane protein OmpA-like peptidoglycan-associated protein